MGTTWTTVDASFPLATFEYSFGPGLASSLAVGIDGGIAIVSPPCNVSEAVFEGAEKLGPVKGKTLAFIGDTASNMGRSYTRASSLFGFQLKLASPEGYHPANDVTDAAKGFVQLVRDPKEAVKGADAVITDVWTSMGQEAESARRLKDLHGYQVTPELMKLAASHALFLHCLPAHPGEEITESVLYGDRQRIWDQAENRRHAQKALLELLVSEQRSEG